MKKLLMYLLSGTLFFSNSFAAAALTPVQQMRENSLGLISKPSDPLNNVKDRCVYQKSPAEQKKYAFYIQEKAFGKMTSFLTALLTNTNSAFVNSVLKGEAKTTAVVIDEYAASSIMGLSTALQAEFNTRAREEHAIGATIPSVVVAFDIIQFMLNYTFEAVPNFAQRYSQDHHAILTKKSTDQGFTSTDPLSRLYNYMIEQAIGFAEADQVKAYIINCARDTQTRYLSGHTTTTARRSAPRRSIGSAIRSKLYLAAPIIYGGFLAYDYFTRPEPCLASSNPALGSMSKEIEATVNVAVVAGLSRLLSRFSK